MCGKLHLQGFGTDQIFSSLCNFLSRSFFRVRLRANRICAVRHLVLIKEEVITIGLTSKNQLPLFQCVECGFQTRQRD